MNGARNIHDGGRGGFYVWTDAHIARNTVLRQTIISVRESCVINIIV